MSAICSHLKTDQESNSHSWKNKIKEQDLKFRGLLDPMNGENNLHSFLSTWLASALNLDHVFARPKNAIPASPETFWPLSWLLFQVSDPSKVQIRVGSHLPREKDFSSAWSLCWDTSTSLKPIMLKLITHNIKFHCFSPFGMQVISQRLQHVIWIQDISWKPCN